MKNETSKNLKDTIKRIEIRQALNLNLLTAYWFEKKTFWSILTSKNVLDPCNFRFMVLLFFLNQPKFKKKIINRKKLTHFKK